MGMVNTANPLEEEMKKVRNMNMNNKLTMNATGAIPSTKFDA